ncbi:hypothetical protein HNQ88_005127 [Aureibacter tunicatorum]|uniref:Uncharacterized protein n=1 Tax=Aureibacter tunicatorum TaxID=866807 RepID=A0AAE3XU47_9BACT|nr:hypothetical protein [Aureibacter tunicatorum]BDD07116.1 hypothetical protein AUTU_45990 [Aureibacter tunicatorum]
MMLLPIILILIPVSIYFIRSIHLKRRIKKLKISIERDPNSIIFHNIRFKGLRSISTQDCNFIINDDQIYIFSKSSVYKLSFRENSILIPYSSKIKLLRIRQRSLEYSSPKN